MESSKKIKKGQLEDYISTATQTALDLKLDKSTTPSSIYATDASGNQEMIPKDSLKGVVEGYKSGANFYEDAIHTILITPETDKLYISITENKAYRWTGSVYVQIGGSIKSRITNTSVSGSYILNHSLASDWKLTLTGATTLSEINLPTGGDTIEFTLKIFGNFPLTIPAYWTVKGDSYSTTLWNFYAIQIHKGDSPQEATAFLTNL